MPTIRLHPCEGQTVRVSDACNDQICKWTLSTVLHNILRMATVRDVSRLSELTKGAISQN